MTVRLIDTVTWQQLSATQLVAEITPRLDGREVNFDAEVRRKGNGLWLCKVDNKAVATDLFTMRQAMSAVEARVRQLNQSAWEKQERAGAQQA